MTKWLILQVFSLFFFNFLLFRWKTFGLLSLWWSCWGSVFNFPDCSCESASIQMICVTLLSSLCCSHPLTGNRCFVRCHQIALSFFNQNRFSQTNVLSCLSASDSFILLISPLEKCIRHKTLFFHQGSSFKVIFPFSQGATWRWEDVDPVISLSVPFDLFLHEFPKHRK